MAVHVLPCVTHEFPEDHPWNFRGEAKVPVLLGALFRSFEGDDPSTTAPF